MPRYKFSPFEVEEQCLHAKRSRHYDRDCDGPELVFISDGTRAALRSNGIPRFIDEDQVTFDIVMAHAKEPVEHVKYMKLHIPITSFMPLFGHRPIDIFIDIADDGITCSVGAIIPKDMGQSSMGCYAEDDDMAPG
jgi:hypothetical protein